MEPSTSDRVCPMVTARPRRISEQRTSAACRPRRADAQGTREGRPQTAQPDHCRDRRRCHCPDRRWRLRRQDAQRRQQRLEQARSYPAHTAQELRVRLHGDDAGGKAGTDPVIVALYRGLPVPDLQVVRAAERRVPRRAGQEGRDHDRLPPVRFLDRMAVPTNTRVAPPTLPCACSTRVGPASTRSSTTSSTPPSPRRTPPGRRTQN